MMYCQYIIFPLLGILNNISASFKKKKFVYIGCSGSSLLRELSLAVVSRLFFMVASLV